MSDESHMIEQTGLAMRLDMITESFDNPILYDPALIQSGHDTLKIITAFTDCERISTHMINLSDGIASKKFVKDISVEIIIGMTKSSLSIKKHNDICRLLHYLNGTRNMPNVSCRYIRNGSEVHSKVYIWGRPTPTLTPYYDIAYIGSLNYTTNAFYKRRESVSFCNPIKAISYYNELLADSVDCFDPLAVERIKSVSNDPMPDAFEPDDEEYEVYNKIEPIDILEVSLLRADGSETGYGSGINWGIRQNGTPRNPNQAYIPYNRSQKKDGFFPDRINPNDKNCPIFKVITKDYGSFHMRMAQDNNKALHSAESNALLGEWIRKRLGVPSGSYVTKRMLENYGRTYVTFRKYEDGTYLLDF